MFKNAFKLPFQLFGIEIRLHWTLLLILPFLAWSIAGHAPRFAGSLGVDPAVIASGYMPLWIGLASAIGLFLSVLIHELGHALTARLYGVHARDITLWLLGGIAQFERMPDRPGAEAVVAIAGPITSIVLGAILWLGQAMVPPTMPGLLVTCFYLAVTNVVLAVFNLLPALPLDGGRVLRSLLALKMGQTRATRVSAGVSTFLAIALALFGFVSGNIFMVMVAFFVYMAVNAETQQTYLSQALDGIAVRDLMTRDVVTVQPDLTVAELKARMLHDHHLGFPVTNGHLMGIVTVHHLKGVPPTARVGDVMSQNLATIPANRSALDALKRMSEDTFGRLVVVDEMGRMVGILTRTDLTHALKIREAGEVGL